MYHGSIADELHEIYTDRCTGTRLPFAGNSSLNKGPHCRMRVFLVKDPTMEVERAGPVLVLL